MRKKITAVFLALALFFSAAAVSEGSPVTRFGIEWMKTKAVLGEENAVISPASGYFALVLAALGAQGETRAEILSALGLTEEDFMEEVRTLRTAISADALAANSVWADEDFPLTDEYRKQASELLGADAFSLKLSSEEAMNAVNQWVSDRTGGLISSVLSEPLSGDAALALVNTLYFKKEWKSFFQAEQTREDAFRTDAGEEVRAEFLNKTAHMRYTALADGAQAVILPYEGEKSVFLAVLPPEGVTADAYAQTLSADAIAEALNGAEIRRVKLSLPKIEKEIRLDMKSSLEEMGVLRAFDKNRAELGGFSQTDAELYLSDAIQKVRLSLAERGTEAAAATMMLANSTAMLSEEPVALSFHRSYLYAVLDAESGAALFMGKVTNPALFGLSSQGAALGRTYSDGVPELYIAADDGWHPAKPGTYSLVSGGLGVEADAVHPLEDESPVTVRVGGGNLRLVFDAEPTSVIARFWKAGETGYESYETLAIEDYVLRVPAGAEGTVEIEAEWKGFTDFEAVVRYSFAVTAD